MIEILTILLIALLVLCYIAIPKTTIKASPVCKCQCEPCITQTCPVCPVIGAECWDYISTASAKEVLG